MLMIMITPATSMALCAPVYLRLPAPLVAAATVRVFFFCFLDRFAITQSPVSQGVYPARCIDGAQDCIIPHPGHNSSKIDRPAIRSRSRLHSLRNCATLRPQTVCLCIAHHHCHCRIMQKMSGWLEVLMLIAGLGLCAFLVQRVSPFLDNGQDNVQAILLMYLGIFLFTVGTFSQLSRQIHARWPALARRPHEDFSLRHGLLAGVAACTMATLALYALLDFAMAVSVIFLVALMETFWQNRKATG